MKTSSAKAKGRNLQNHVRDLLRTRYISTDPVISPEDIEGRGMGQQGTDIILTPVAKEYIPFDIECKAQENLNIWSALKQTETNTTPGRTPLLIFKRNRTEVYCTLKFEDLLKLI